MNDCSRTRALLLHRCILSVAAICLYFPPISSAGPQPQAKAAQKLSASPARRASKASARLTPVAAHRAQQPAELRELKILPSTINLTGPRVKERLVVEGVFADGHEEDLTLEARFSSSNPKIVAVNEVKVQPLEGPEEQQAIAEPVSDGEAEIEATCQGHRARAPAVVKNSAGPFAWSFRNDVLPVMTKMGCNSGPCHGAAAGKNGFKLTLRGYDPETDYYTLTHQSLARRTDRLEPAKSLMLLKPTLTIPHGGGERFKVGSPEYQVISGWIAAGLPPPRDSEPRIVGLEVLPREATLNQEASQQLIVLGRFSDGHTSDVTRWAKYTSGDDGVANVDQSGHVKMRGYGEAPVTVWYSSRVAFASLRVPYPVNLDEAVFRNARRNNFIDDLVLKKLAALHIPPSRSATDSEFMRRAYLDSAGILPTPAEVEKFLQDTAPDKRARLIDQLTLRPEFVDYWAYKWSDLLLVSSRKLTPAAMWSFYNWIHDSVAADKPWDEFAREIIASSGSTLKNGAVNYYVIHREPTDIAENVTQAFMAMSITCAHCHNHPLEKWTQRDYFSMANMFARVRLKNATPSGYGRPLEDVTVFSSPTGDFIYPRLGRPLPPRPLDADPLAPDSSLDRRAYFAEWLTSPKNPYFARALVNRVWKNFMGRGLVEPVDDMRATNPPSNEELLNALAQDFIRHGFDVRYLIRTIMNSATYQTASEPTPQNVQDEKYYSHYMLKRLPAEVLLDAYSQVTQNPEEFAGYPVGMRALQLPDSEVDSYFLTAFGRPPRLRTSESERQSEPSITQALHVINGDTLNRKLRDPNGTVAMLLKLGLSNERIVNYLYLAALCRYPTDTERNEILGDLQSGGKPPRAGWGADTPQRAALEDLMWATLTSDEFVFNH